MITSKENGEPIFVDGAPLVIEDMPMTLQGVKSAPSLIALFDLIVKQVLRQLGGIGKPDIDGVERVSVKYEPAPLFGLYSGLNATARSAARSSGRARREHHLDRELCIHRERIDCKACRLQREASLLRG